MSKHYQKDEKLVPFKVEVGTYKRNQIIKKGHFIVVKFSKGFDDAGKRSHFAFCRRLYTKSISADRRAGYLR